MMIDRALLGPLIGDHLTRDNLHRLVNALTEYVTQGKQERIKEVLPWRTRYLTVVLEDIYQTQNASATIRSCDLSGIQDLHVIEKRNNFRVNKAVTQGASKWVDVYRHSSVNANCTVECLDHLRAEGYQLAALTPNGAEYSLRDLPLEKPTALLFGTEETGLSQEALDAADLRVTIPMFGFSHSYNLSVSVALALNSLTERIHASDLSWQLTELDALRLKVRWFAKSAANGDSLLKHLLETESIT